MKILIALEGTLNQGPNFWARILFKELFRQFNNYGENQVHQVKTTNLKSLIYTVFHIRKFDVFHFYSESPGAALLFLLFKLFRKKTVYTMHGNMNEEAKYKPWPINLLWVPAHLFVMKHSDAITYPSNFLRSEIQIYFKSISARANHYVIPNGVFVREYPQEKILEKANKLKNISSGNESLHILSVTSFTFEPKTKGVDLLVEMNNRLQERGIKTEIRIGGNGLLWGDYKKKYESKNVKFLGYCDNYLENQWADIFIHLSFLDNLPFVILNAGSVGIPTIASEIGGIPEIFCLPSNKIQWGLTSNKVEVIADKINDLIQHQKLYLDVSKEQYENIKQRFNIQTVAEQFWNLYTQI